MADLHGGLGAFTPTFPWLGKGVVLHTYGPIWHPFLGGWPEPFYGSNLPKYGSFGVICTYTWIFQVGCQMVFQRVSIHHPLGLWFFAPKRGRCLCAWICRNVPNFTLLKPLPLPQGKHLTHLKDPQNTTLCHLESRWRSYVLVYHSPLQIATLLGVASNLRTHYEVPTGFVTACQFTIPYFLIGTLGRCWCIYIYRYK